MAKRKRSPGWTVILVPPRPGAPTREVHVSTRSLVTVGTFALMIVAGAATYTGETTKLASNTADRLAESQSTIVGLLDSVQILQAMAARAGFTPREIELDISAVLQGEPAPTPVVVNDRAYTIRVRFPMRLEVSSRTFSDPFRASHLIAKVRFQKPEHSSTSKPDAAAAFSQSRRRETYR